MSHVADSSWLYALLDGSDAHHEAAMGQAKAVAKVHVPPAVLVETLSLISFRSKEGNKAARQAANLLGEMPVFVVGQPAHDHEVTVRIWDTHRTLSYVDAAAIGAARRLSLPLLTFDAKQRKAHASGRP